MAEVLVVASKVKKYIKEKGDMSTSATAISRLSEIIEEECNKAIERAKSAKRKTVMDRDFEE
ncbi:MAG: hypothetical protein COT84_01045 [Chlamydiae bacterium CG10_big_fil_rev_8_21_14_0_10_35_9]|nr:MAG: hypothetical protein COT84_01045 [Chlamydiae bacterium CG10_big_fil_rev_8_21_14_0_10_35_9]